MVMDLLRHSSIVALLGLVVSVLVVAMALAYAIKPDERRLALIRPMSLAAICGGLSSFTVGIASSLRHISETPSFTVDNWQPMTAGMAESVLGLFVVFSCLTIAWLLVTLGLRRA
jgi:ABC-type transport system involved in cytochrome c biogenesis permease subunit